MTDYVKSFYLKIYTEQMAWIVPKVPVVLVFLQSMSSTIEVTFGSDLK